MPSSVLLAKPTGITLEEHNANLQEQAEAYFVARPFVLKKYRERTGEDLQKTVRQAIKWHDIGKQHVRWQAACLKEYELFNKIGKVDGRFLRDTKIRHEMHSLFVADKNKRSLDPVVRVAIAAHHNKLSHRHERRWKEDDSGNFAPLWGEFRKLAGTIDHWAFEEAIAVRYRFSGPRALLQLCDHRASAKEDKAVLPPFLSFQYTFPYGDDNKRGVQREIVKLYDEPFGILRAPTGSGKTDAALLWAKHQIDSGRADRLIIAMPTRFTASALAISTANSLGKAGGLYHSSAWLQRDQKDGFAEKEHALARLLETPATVTTIDHLCLCLTGRREDHHAIFWGLANSCVVIDESDFYDAFTQANMIVLLRALRLMNVPVLLMSATVPDSSRTLYARSGYAVPKIVEDTENADETRCKVIRRGATEGPSDVADLLTFARNGSPLIIYANTVKRAQAYYDYLILNGFKDVILYHSRFTEPDKAQIEVRLREQLGADAWKEESAHGIAVLTQIGELSINISADRMISDRCPLDRLVQRIGRLSRFGRTVGEIYIVQPTQNGELYPAPYGEYRSGTGWIASPSFIKTDILLSAEKYTRAELVELVDRLYPAAEEEDTRVADNRQHLEQDAVNNWLIVPKREVAEDADEDEMWRCRDIGPQSVVYVGWAKDAVSDPETYFSTWGAFREKAQKHAVTLHTYEFNNAVHNGWLKNSTINIGDETQTIWEVVSQFYSTKRGISFPDPEAE